MIDYKINNEMLDILEKIHKGLMIDYDGNFINEDYMFTVKFKDFDNYCECITIEKDKCIDENDARIYLIITLFIECITECKLYKNIKDYDYESFKKWLYYIGDESFRDEEEIKILYPEYNDIFNDFKEGLDKANFARTILTKNERFKFGEFVENNNRYKNIVKYKINIINKQLKKL
ncbi:hypothetical protein ACQPUY_15690 [Clostridium nigeriense]|uniref:hypothetical protein n=1 Tax=Clostridium nigeriense TaxID=1805470 RepID=UPI003D33082C